MGIDVTIKMLCKELADLSKLTVRSAVDSAHYRLTGTRLR